MVAADSMEVGARSRQFFLLMSVLLLFTGTAQALGVKIDSASTKNIKGVYQLNADIHYELSEAVREALNNSVAITMQLTIKIVHPRPYLWDESIATLFQHYELKYHALSGQYIVHFLDSDENRVICH